jgi:beta-phosphoglucomutase
MLRAIILDFDGVILNSEPLHFGAMRDTVAGLGVRLSREEYWDRYLPMDDAQCLDAICRDRSIRLSDEKRNSLLELKAGLYRRLLKEDFSLFPGAAQFIQNAARNYPLGLASGARRDEIESTLQSAGLKDHFVVVVAAEDFKLGKPQPESFLFALERLNTEIKGQTPPILPGECLVVEDSVGSVQGARRAGMLCMAVTNSYPREMLQAANTIVASLEDVRLDSLEALFEESA